MPFLILLLGLGLGAGGTLIAQELLPAAPSKRWLAFWVQADSQITGQSFDSFTEAVIAAGNFTSDQLPGVVVEMEDGAIKPQIAAAVFGERVVTNPDLVLVPIVPERPIEFV